jgi:ferredoxin like protein
MSIDAKLGQNAFKLDKQAHIVINQSVCRTSCVNRACLTVCPADLYSLNPEGEIVINWEGCLECGTCMISCDGKALSWQYPQTEFGVQYRSS